MYATAKSEEEYVTSGRESYSYFLSSRQKFADPSLVHQFVVQWPWPVSSERHEVKRGSNDNGIVKPQASRDDLDAEPPHNAALPVLDVATRRYGRPTTILSVSSDPHHPSRDGPTGDGLYDPQHVRRVAMLLSPGHRLYVPLLPVPAEETEPRVADARGRTVDSRGEVLAPQYWRVAHKAARHAAPTPSMTELVVGDLASIDWLVAQWPRHIRHQGRSPATLHHSGGERSSRHTSATSASVGGVGSPFSTRINLAVPTNAASSAEEGHPAEGAGEAERQRALPRWVRPTPRPSQIPVFSYLTHSVPAKVLWLDAVPGRLVLSLPCEERLVTVHVPFGTRPHASLSNDAPQMVPGYTPGQCEPVPLRSSSSFSLPRGVVPLDVVELLHRPFLAVGTYEHGVLLCWLDLHTGAVGGIAQAISLSGMGSAVFPVTTIAAVFPPLWPSPHNLDWPRHAQATQMLSKNATGTFALPWQAQARFLASLQQGSLVCSSPFDSDGVVLKGIGASGGAGATFENTVGRGQDALLSTSSCCDDDVGCLCVTSSGQLVRYQLFHEHTAAAAEAHRTWSGVVRTRKRHTSLSGLVSPSPETKEESSEDDTESVDALPTPPPRSSHVDDNGKACGPDLALALAAQYGKVSHATLSERLSPILLRTLSLRSNHRLHQLGTTAPVYQLKPSKWDPLDGAMVQHFMLATTTANEVILLDRVLTTYKVLSTFTLSAVHAGTARGAESSAADEQQGGQRAHVKSEPRDKDGDAPRRDVAASHHDAGTDGPLHSEDLCAGVVFLASGHQWLTAAAAHHGNVVSVLRYAGSDDEVGHFKRSYQASPARGGAAKSQRKE